MPTPTYTPLATVTLGASASSVTFGSIPATYRDLIIVHNNLGTADAGDSVIRFNSDSGSNYSRVIMYGNGSSALSASATGQTSLSLFFPRTTVGFASLQIMDYSATDKHKTVLNRTDTADYVAWASAGRWANTAAITSIYLAPSTGQFATGFTVSLYGIAS
jgi:hypothetical protein